MMVHQAPMRARRSRQLTAGSQIIEPSSKPGQHEPATYEIRLQGHLGARLGEHLGVPDLRYEADGTTLMRVVAADQSSLHGLLQKIRDLNLPLLSVNRLGSPEPDHPSRLSTKSRTPK